MGQDFVVYPFVYPSPTKKTKGSQRLNCKPLFYMARPKRFELLTPWFVAKYSIQLSYGRITCIIIETDCFLKIKLAESEGFEPSIQI